MTFWNWLIKLCTKRVFVLLVALSTNEDITECSKLMNGLAERCIDKGKKILDFWVISLWKDSSLSGRTWRRHYCLQAKSDCQALTCSLWKSCRFMAFMSHFKFKICANPNKNVFKFPILSVTAFFLDTIILYVNTVFTRTY